jgi:DNA-directed RNA polymerase I subunit RPA1
LWSGITPHPTKRSVRIRDPGIFFLNALPVPPSRFRPPSFAKGMLSDHPQNDFFVKILTAKHTLKALENKEEVSPTDRENVKIQYCVEIQMNVNCVADNTPDMTKKVFGQGIKQILERKQGIFRKNMMGKRVNFAARSVISPDPNLDTDEIGIPEYFAKVSSGQGE